eukprot:TRINITY_DN11192_c0_g2_i1.p2 TRINITY_DN11192_c0_g2~~TRINITY_DN11192_c0_g2_i1.p2  ORF type:complete len:103 (+),score=5.85 TRINITY_DN11192_c0_g2_i1:348-656(+)
MYVGHGQMSTISVACTLPSLGWADVKQKQRHLAYRFHLSGTQWAHKRMSHSNRRLLLVKADLSVCHPGGPWVWREFVKQVKAAQLLLFYNKGIDLYTSTSTK